MVSLFWYISDLRYLSENVLLKMDSVKLATVTSSVKGFHVYRRNASEKYRRSIGEKFKCVLKETNRHSNTTIKVVRDANEIIGHIPDGLSKVVAPALKKEIELSVAAEVTGHLRDAAEEKWTLGGGIKVLYIYRFYVKSKAKFRNKLVHKLKVH